MIELVISGCLMSSPFYCRDYQLQFADVTAFQCIMFSQTELAKWKDEHPNVRIERWRCQQPGQFAKL